MTTEPVFESVTNYTSDLLDLVAEDRPATPTERDEWQLFVDVVHEVAGTHGVVDQNDVRPRIRGQIKPNRIGAFYHRACSDGWLVADGWSISADREGRNAGRPMRRYRLTDSPGVRTIPPRLPAPGV